jgi:hypothetical protein
MASLYASATRLRTSVGAGTIEGVRRRPYANNDASYVAIADIDYSGLPDLVGDGTATSIYFGHCFR